MIGRFIIVHVRTVTRSLTDLPITWQIRRAGFTVGHAAFYHLHICIRLDHGKGALPVLLKVIASVHIRIVGNGEYT